ncbi:hypothetical protein ABT354_23140 [Streptomyces sp. NPDC000594]|uniref:hypothetical protein n=1 Tax=Streptomyces sp. NPDC000594 TaxID=3154261 RepID=UPI00332FC0EA
MSTGFFTTAEEKKLRYVSVEMGAGGEQVLRARAATAGSWEKFVLEPAPSEMSGTPPAVWPSWPRRRTPGTHATISGPGLRRPRRVSLPAT